MLPASLHQRDQTQSEEGVQRGDSDDYDDNDDDGDDDDDGQVYDEECEVILEPATEQQCTQVDQVMCPCYLHYIPVVSRLSTLSSAPRCTSRSA